MRFRPPYVAMGVMLVVSATVGAAIAAERSVAGPATMTPAQTAGGSTSVPASEESIGVIPFLGRQGSDSIPGRYCPLPAREVRTPAAAADSDSSADIALYGQSAVPSPAPAAICTGISPATALDTALARSLKP